MFSTELLDIHLNTEFLGSKINYQSETNSTNIEAWNHIDYGCEEGTIFITDNQKKGVKGIIEYVTDYHIVVHDNRGQLWNDSGTVKISAG